MTKAGGSSLFSRGGPFCTQSTSVSVIVSATSGCSPTKSARARLVKSTPHVTNVRYEAAARTVEALALCRSGRDAPHVLPEPQHSTGAQDRRQSVVGPRCHVSRQKRRRRSVPATGLGVNAGQSSSDPGAARARVHRMSVSTRVITTTARPGTSPPRPSRRGRPPPHRPPPRAPRPVRYPSGPEPLR